MQTLVKLAMFINAVTLYLRRPKDFPWKLKSSQHSSKAAGYE